ncbi:MAG: hypothetical protein AAGI68_05765 [Planctomycetota bacterium]
MRRAERDRAGTRRRVVGFGLSVGALALALVGFVTVALAEPAATQPERAESREPAGDRPPPPRPEGEPEHHRRGPEGDRPPPPERGMRERGERPKERPRGGPGKAWSAEDLQRAEAVMRAFYPRVADRFARLRQDDPAAAGRLLDERFPLVFRLMQQQRRDPAMFRLRVTEARLLREAMRLRWRYGQAEDAAKKAELATAIKAKLGEAFDTRQAMRQRELEELADRLEGLRAEQAEAGQRREAIIAERFERMLDAGPGSPEPVAQRDRPAHSAPSER